MNVIISLFNAEFNDYYPLNNEQLVFFSGDTEQCVNVTIVDDEDHERREYFGITVTTDFPFVYFLRNLTVNILDNDGKIFLIYCLLVFEVSILQISHSECLKIGKLCC